MSGGVQIAILEPDIFFICKWNKILKFKHLLLFMMFFKDIFGFIFYVMA